MDFEEVSVSQFTRLLHPYPTFLVSSVGRDGRANLITIAWLIPVSVRPPLLAMAVRRERYSYGLIVESGEFVVHAVPFDRAREALFCGRRSGRDVDKIATLGLESVPGRVVKAPVVPEVGVAFLECRLQQEVEAGDHVLFIAEVVAAYTRPGFLEDGVRDLAAAPPLLHVGGPRFATTALEIVEPEV
ncbi:MAG TPA: flavin reductase family protein [Chloroflexi bacterium]|nr:flavin reductase family protein [Chloroflexota bacterium]